MRIFFTGISGSWRISSAAWFRPVTIRVRSAGTSGRIRSTVSRMIVRSPRMSSRCFGILSRLRGQNRDPFPPAMMTANMDFPPS
jgi:hypothetical protein